MRLQVVVCVEMLKLVEESELEPRLGSRFTAAR